LHKIAVISACNSLDQSYWHFVDIADFDCEYTSYGDIDCGEKEYDLNINDGFFEVILPVVEMEGEYDLSPETCFETHYEIQTTDGAEYVGPLYINEFGALSLDSPYDHVGETFSARVQVVKQQPISEYGFSLPVLTGTVTIIDSSIPLDQDAPFLMSNIYSTSFGDDNGENYLTYDYSLISGASSECAVADEFRDFEVRMNHAIKLQTVFIKMDTLVYGSIYGIVDGIEQWCQTDVALDGFVQCELYTDTIMIRVPCENADNLVNVAEFYLLQQRVIVEGIESFQIDNEVRQDAFGLVSSVAGFTDLNWVNELNINFIESLPVIGVMHASGQQDDSTVTVTAYNDDSSNSCEGTMDVLSMHLSRVDCDSSIDATSVYIGGNGSQTTVSSSLAIFVECNSFDESEFAWDNSVGDFENCDFTTDPPTCDFIEFDVAT
jgi:hypothetical protein